MSVLVVCAVGDGLDLPSWAADRLVDRQPDASRCAAVHATFADHLTRIEPRGVAVFGHGSETAAFGDGGAVLIDGTSVHLLDGRWAYAFACRCGVELAGLAVHAGCRVFAGYEAAVIVDWDPSGAPEIEAVTADFLTAVPVALASGETRRSALVELLNPMAEKLMLWCSENPGSYGLEILAQQLLERLVVRSAEDLDVSS